jgi:hypothetical protein
MSTRSASAAVWRTGITALSGTGGTVGIGAGVDDGGAVDGVAAAGDEVAPDWVPEAVGIGLLAEGVTAAGDATAGPDGEDPVEAPPHAERNTAHESGRDAHRSSGRMTVTFDRPAQPGSRTFDG